MKIKNKMIKLSNELSKKAFGVKVHHVIELSEELCAGYVYEHGITEKPYLIAVGIVTKNKKGYTITTYDFNSNMHKTYLNPNVWIKI